MTYISFLACCLQGPTKVISEKELMSKAASTYQMLFGHLEGEKPWHVDRENPREFSNNTVLVYFSKDYPGRISGITRIGLHNRMLAEGPKQGDRFKTMSEWEEFGFKQIQRIWTDVDGCVISFRRVGEIVEVHGGRKSWASNSNTVSVIWFTHPVNGKIRQFSVGMDRATGDILDIACSGFSKAPEQWEVRKRTYIKLDNSKKRKTKVALPPG